MIFPHDNSTFCQKTGTLQLEIPVINTRLRISSWKSGLNWEILNNQNWDTLETDSGIHLLDHLEAVEEEHPVRQFLNKIPEEILGPLVPYITSQSYMLRWLGKSLYAKQFIETDPTLFWFLSTAAVSNEFSDDDFEYCLKRKKNKLIQFLTRSETSVKGGVSLFRKFRANRYTQSEYELIDRFFRSDCDKSALFHLSEIPISFLDLFIKHYELAQWILALKTRSPELDMLELSDQCQASSFLVIDTQRMADALGINFWLHMRRHINSLQGLNAFHNELSVRYRERDINIHDATVEFRKKTALGKFWIKLKRLMDYLTRKDRFPDPGINDSKQIKRIKSIYELRKEGAEQNHCVFSYHDHAMTGRYFYYRVLTLERATLEISKHENKFHIKQMKLKRNGVPAPETYRFVQDWLDDVNGRWQYP